MELDLKIYRGYANDREVVIMGHVFREKAPDRVDTHQSKWKHSLAILRMFRVRTADRAQIDLSFNGKQIRGQTEEDGFFQLIFPYEGELESGWHEVEITARTENHQRTERGEFIKPHPGEYGLISDIDDTFLVSHSGNALKKLYVMLTRNVQRRKVFTGVVEHYRALSQAGREHPSKSNIFFYVSSSEWNLYHFINEFTELHDFPKAVLKLKDIKSGLRDFLKTGAGDHDHKFHKIKHILEFYPRLHFVLFGDDSQQDPDIYERLVARFPKNIKAVYIRQTEKTENKSTRAHVERMEALGVAVCYFRESEQAMEHSQSVGLLSAD
ncbi:App1 family protein [Croceiramulus getboli]|nr:App1 family protein [Flavobacteriaceae bacterium YJPT1-3]